jgi:hypothetical protein
MAMLLFGVSCAGLGYLATDLWLAVVSRRGPFAVAEARTHGAVALAATAAYVSIALLL